MRTSQRPARHFTRNASNQISHPNTLPHALARSVAWTAHITSHRKATRAWTHIETALERQQKLLACPFLQQLEYLVQTLGEGALAKLHPVTYTPLKAKPKLIVSGARTHACTHEKTNEGARFDPFFLPTNPRNLTHSPGPRTCTTISVPLPLLPPPFIVAGAAAAAGNAAGTETQKKHTHPP